jgi:di/tricarboxylate transporter
MNKKRTLLLIFLLIMLVLISLFWSQKAIAALNFPILLELTWQMQWPVTILGKTSRA